MKNEFFLLSLKAFILLDPITSPSCDVCGYVHSFSRQTIKGLEGQQSVNLCHECLVTIERSNSEAFEILSTEEVY